MKDVAVSARIVLDPELPYERIAAAVEELGWRHVGGPQYPPLVPGEPEFATWRRDDDTLVYACNPVAWLRVLDLTAVTDPWQRLALLAALPLLPHDQLPQLLRSAATESLLLGILAADIMDDRKQLGTLRALMHHRDPVAATAAQRVVARMTAPTAGR
jgi:hypothetical protein